MVSGGVSKIKDVKLIEAMRAKSSLTMRLAILVGLLLSVLAHQYRPRAFNSD